MSPGRTLDAIAAQPVQAVFEAGVNQNVNQLPASNPRASAKSLMSGLRQELTGGREGIRTPDPLLAKQVLSQLSYGP